MITGISVIRLMRLEQDDMNIDDLKTKPEDMLAFLREHYPVLYTITKLNMKILKDMNYGEVRLTEFVKAGKIYRVQAEQMIGEMVETQNTTVT